MKLTGDRCKCSVCGEFFNPTSAFDKHRTGSFDPQKRRCRTESEMLAKGTAKSQALFWVGKLFGEGKTRVFQPRAVRSGGYSG